MDLFEGQKKQKPFSLPKEPDEDYSKIKYKPLWATVKPGFFSLTEWTESLTSSFGVTTKRLRVQFGSVCSSSQLEAFIQPNKLDVAVCTTF